MLHSVASLSDTLAASTEAVATTALLLKTSKFELLRRDHVAVCDLLEITLTD